MYELIIKFSVIDETYHIFMLNILYEICIYYEITLYF